MAAPGGRQQRGGVGGAILLEECPGQPQVGGEQVRRECARRSRTRRPRQPAARSPATSRLDEGARGRNRLRGGQDPVDPGQRRRRVAERRGHSRGVIGRSCVGRGELHRLSERLFRLLEHPVRLERQSQLHPLPGVFRRGEHGVLSGAEHREHLGLVIRHIEGRRCFEQPTGQRADREKGPRTDVIDREHRVGTILPAPARFNVASASCGSSRERASSVSRAGIAQLVGVSFPSWMSPVRTRFPAPLQVFPRRRSRYPRPEAPRQSPGIVAAPPSTVVAYFTGESGEEITG